jgi:hypothetical protein
VTARSLVGDFVVRVAEEHDGDALSGFACSSGAAYEDDVERFIRTTAAQHAKEPSDLFRLLLIFERRRLAGCMAHVPEGLLVKPRSLILATRLQVLALSTQDQGRILPDGRRLADLALSTLLADALDTREPEVLTAIVARDNIRSLAVCERHGLRSQVPHGSDCVRLSSRFVRRD